MPLYIESYVSTDSAKHANSPQRNWEGVYQKVNLLIENLSKGLSGKNQEALLLSSPEHKRNFFNSPEVVLPSQKQKEDSSPQLTVGEAKCLQLLHVLQLNAPSIVDIQQQFASCSSVDHFETQPMVNKVLQLCLFLLVSRNQQKSKAIVMRTIENSLNED